MDHCVTVIEEVTKVIEPANFFYEIKPLLEKLNILSTQELRLLRETIHKDDDLTEKDQQVNL